MSSADLRRAGFSSAGLRRSGPRGILTAVQPLLELLVVFLFVTTFVFQTTRIPSSSMVPTLRVGDLLVVDKQSYTSRNHGDPLVWLLPPTAVHRGDLAVFLFPPDPTQDLVKRIVGLPGDRLRLHNGIVFLNGLPLAEPYATHSPFDFNSFRDDFPDFHATDPSLDPLWWATMRRIVHEGELTVPPDEVFVLGDNRDNSEDSRYWGFVPTRNLIGRPLVVYLRVPSQPLGLAGLHDRIRHGLHSLRVVR